MPPEAIDNPEEREKDEENMEDDEREQARELRKPEKPAKVKSTDKPLQKSNTAKTINSKTTNEDFSDLLDDDLTQSPDHSSDQSELQKLQRENRKLLRKITNLEKRHKILENKLKTQTEIQQISRRPSIVRYSNTRGRISSNRMTQMANLAQQSSGFTRQRNLSNPSGNLNNNSSSFFQQVNISHQTSGSSSTLTTSKVLETPSLSKVKSSKSITITPETDGLLNAESTAVEQEDDPDVDMLLEKGPLTRQSLEQLQIKKRKPKENLPAGFRVLQESRESNHVAIEKISEGVLHLNSLTKIQVKVKWVHEPGTVLIIKRPNDTVATQKLALAAISLNKRRINVLLEQAVEKEVRPLLSQLDLTSSNAATVDFVDSKLLFNEVIDFVVCLGGDGTILWTSGLFPGGVPPIVSFKMGSLGFLTPFDIEDFEDKIKRVLTKDVEVTIRSRLLVRVTKKHNNSNNLLPNSSGLSSTSSEFISEQYFTCLNEVTIKHPSKMVSLDLYVNDDKITVVHADGLIIATPTGSTAYSLACGGSMLHPALPAMVVTPIAPHTLSFRPIVLSDSSTLKISVPAEARSEAYVSFDGRESVIIAVGDSVEVTLSEFPVVAFCKGGESQDWFETIKESFLWNVRTTQKQLNN